MMEQAEPPSSGMLAKFQSKMTQRYQQILDKITPWILYRWIGTLVVMAVYFVRVFFLKGFYIVTYGIGIYILNLFIAFLSPQTDPDSEGPTLPSVAKDEYKPFVRRLPEFKFWLGITKAFCIGFFMTFFPAFDIPVFWPILLCYWLMLLYLTMRKQIQHMIKHKYLPFSGEKKSYQGNNVRGHAKVRDLQDLQGSAVATSVMPPKQLAKK